MPMMMMKTVIWIIMMDMMMNINDELKRLKHLSKYVDTLFHVGPTSIGCGLMHGDPVVTRWTTNPKVQSSNPDTVSVDNEAFAAEITRDEAYQQRSRRQSNQCQFGI
ncbi:hypothetical protein DPMN_130909 [Dreissena polymorpha]|uniref:Uncharacterized protein n=1 Tax=Dreissena polymorpha TaxID=45954 RepID=A0A9D4H3P1_DREPO|nr:hypothetical protein DPMN_130909 [Dreissena polymorpha]